jgi:hypothetical protein
MSDLDALRRAMQAPPDEQFGALDIDKIMTTGKWIRRRRRASIGAAAVLATAAVVVGVTTFIQPTPPSPPAQQPVLPTVSDPVPTAPKLRQLGDLVRTGIQHPDGEQVFFMYLIDAPDLPDVHFGIASGHRTPSGYVRDGIANNDFQNENGGRPGFHHISGGSDDTGTFTPAFGYYVGPAARIEARVLGRTVRARTAEWSEDKNIKLFWFPEDLVPDADLLGRPTAYDAQGKRLP